jgi:hypothetical protein
MPSRVRSVSRFVVPCVHPWCDSRPCGIVNIGAVFAAAGLVCPKNRHFDALQSRPPTAPQHFKKCQPQKNPATKNNASQSSTIHAIEAASPPTLLIRVHPRQSAAKLSFERCPRHGIQHLLTRRASTPLPSPPWWFSARFAPPPCRHANATAMMPPVHNMHNEMDRGLILTHNLPATCAPIQQEQRNRRILHNPSKSAPALLPWRIANPCSASCPPGTFVPRLGTAHRN